MSPKIIKRPVDLLAYVDSNYEFLNHLLLTLLHGAGFNSRLDYETLAFQFAREERNLYLLLIDHDFYLLFKIHFSKRIITLTY